MSDDYQLTELQEKILELSKGPLSTKELARRA
jgi:DNA-binding CsgD family transcriptional regulator